MNVIFPPVAAWWRKLKSSTSHGTIAHVAHALSSARDSTIRLFQRCTYAIIAMGVICSSCSPSSQQSQGIAAARELRIATSFPVASLGPSDDSGQNQWPLPYSCLLATDSHDDLIPDLASMVPSQANGLISKDGLTIDYPLRANARWQDGTPVTAADVIFTRNAILDPRNDYSMHYPYDQIRSLTAVGPHRLRVRLSHIYAPIIYKFFAGGFCYPIVPKHLLANVPSFHAMPFNGQPIGSGPYKAIKFVRGDYIDFAANPYYFLGKPKLNLQLMFTPDPNSLRTMLETGEVDATFSASPAEAYPLKNNPNLTVSVVPQPVVGTITFNVSDPITKDVALRQAIRFAIDRSSIARRVSLGYFDPTSADREVFGWAYDATDPQPGYDLNKANALLDASGWKRGSDGIRSRNGTRLQLILASRLVGVDPNIDVQLQASLLRAGIEVVIKTYNDAQFFAPASQKGIYEGANFQMMYFSALMQDFDADYSAELECGLATPKGDNFARYCNPQLDIANRAAYSSYDRATRRKYYAVVQRLFWQNPAQIYLWTIPKIDIFTKRLKNFVPSAARTSYYNVENWELSR